MSTPANIVSELNFLESQITAAQPLGSASAATIFAIQLNANQLVADLETAVTNAAGTLDTWQAPKDNPELAISGFESLVENANDQTALALMRGIVGRVAANVDQVVQS